MPFCHKMVRIKIRNVWKNYAAVWSVNVHLTSEVPEIASLALCVGNSPMTGEFPGQRPVTRSFGVFFDLRLNKRLSKQSCGWWFEKQSLPLWRHCNGHVDCFVCYHQDTRSSLLACRHWKPTISHAKLFTLDIDKKHQAVLLESVIITKL